MVPCEVTAYRTSGVYTYSVVKEAMTAARPRNSKMVELLGPPTRPTVAAPHSSNDASSVLHQTTVTWFEHHITMNQELIDAQGKKDNHKK